MSNIKNILEVLWYFESAPSAYVLARACSSSPCSDAEIDWAYNCSDSIDSETETVVKSLSSEQLAELKEQLLAIQEERSEDEEIEIDVSKLLA